MGLGGHIDGCLADYMHPREKKKGQTTAPEIKHYIDKRPNDSKDQRLN